MEFNPIESFLTACEAAPTQVPLPDVWLPVARLWRYSVLEPYWYYWHFFEHRDPACAEGWLRTCRWHADDLCFAAPSRRPKVFFSDVRLGAEDIATLSHCHRELTEPEPIVAGIYDGPYYGLVLYEYGVQKTPQTWIDQAPFSALKQVFSERLQQHMGWPEIETARPGFPNLG